MRTIEVKRGDLRRDLLKKIPTRADYKELVAADTRIVDSQDGRVIAVYKVLPEEMTRPMREVCLKTQYSKSTRTSGLPTQSASFGAMPRIAIRNDWCRMTTNTLEEPENWKVVRAFAETISDVYHQYLPAAWEANQRAVEEGVHADWRMGQLPFTSCGINVNHALKYHLDAGNFKGVYSNVLILKRGVAGGYLVLPEFGIAFEQPDNALILFDGQGIVHGVVPIARTHPHGYRMSVVFYALAAMRNCYPYAEELKRIRAAKTRREIEREKHTRPEAGTPEAGAAAS